MLNQNENVNTIETHSKNGSYLTGAIGAILGALIGAIPWAIIYYFGWFVGWLGFLIGVCAIKGYFMLRGKKGWLSVFIIIVAVILGVISGQVLGEFLGFAKYIANGELSWMKYSDIPNVYFTILFNDSEVLTETLVNLGIGLIFACLGVWGIVKNMISDIKSGPQEVATKTISENSSVVETIDVQEDNLKI